MLAGCTKIGFGREKLSKRMERGEGNVVYVCD
jgi:hypothetical protein